MELLRTFLQTRRGLWTLAVGGTVVVLGVVLAAQDSSESSLASDQTSSVVETTLSNDDSEIEGPTEWASTTSLVPNTSSPLASIATGSIPSTTLTPLQVISTVPTSATTPVATTPTTVAPTTTTTTVPTTTTTTSTTTTTTVPAQPPSAPSVTSLSATSSAVTLSWTAPADNGAPITDYIVQYRRSNTATWSSFSDGVSDSASITVTGLSSGAGHFFQVAAVNSAGTSSYSSVTTACTQTCTRDDAYTVNAGSGANSSIYAVAVQSDGKIIYSGSFTTWSGVTVNRIVRLNTNGTLDSAFTTNTGAGLNASADNIEIQPDGKIILVGSFTTMNGATANRVVRLNSDGTRDTAFSTNNGTGADANVLDAKVQSDGKIVFVGTYGSWNGTQVKGIFRLNADGTRDTTFTTNIGGGIGINNTARRLAIQSDGKIIFGGNFLNWNSVAVGGIVRLNSDGTRDATFTTNVGTGGNVGGANHVGSIVVDADGKILLAGQFSTWNGVASASFMRLNSDGTADTAFQTAVGAGPSSRISDIAIQSDGKLVLVGQFAVWNGNVSSPYRIVLLNSGARDTTFLNTGFDRISSTSWAVAIDSSGKKIFVGDFLTYGGTSATDGVPVGYHFRQN